MPRTKLGAELVVSAASEGMRADVFVASAMARDAAPTRSEVQRWMAAGLVTRGGRALRAADKVRGGELIEVVPAPPPRTELVPDESVRFDVLYADEAIVVVMKPAGLVVHPARGHVTGTLVHGLLARGFFDARDRASVLGELEETPGEYLRPGIVHRLDKGTSGVMVVARTGAAREALKKQFAAHTIERVYEALVVGRVVELHHDTLHGRHPTDRLRFTTRVRQGKRAVTDVEVVRRFGQLATHVRCRLSTGRTHQIRVHLAESGTPVLGDPLYARGKITPELQKLAEAIGHQALHAYILGFVHPKSGERVRFEASAPGYLTDAIRQLSSTGSS